MTIKQRREREKEEMKELILSAANDIATLEGFDNISIRKIAKKIEYSPSIIYHYFKDKDEIINLLMQRGYKKIIAAVSVADKNFNSPEEKIVELTRNYMNTALQMSDEFLQAQLNESPLALKHTASLFKGASKEKPALAQLFKCVKEINEELNDDEAEIISQIVAVSTLGLIIKLIKEKNIGDEQKKKLIDYFSNETVLKIIR